jgi:hypothetical protein
MQLLETTNKYRVETEEEAINLINNCKEKQIGGGYEVTKSGYVLKTKKSKGEIVESWYIVTLVMNYNIGD